MIRIARLALLTLASTSFLLALTARAQQLDCSDTVKAALQQTGDKCTQIGRNKACYGSTLAVLQLSEVRA